MTTYVRVGCRIYLEDGTMYKIGYVGKENHGINAAKRESRALQKSGHKVVVGSEHIRKRKLADPLRDGPPIDVVPRQGTLTLGGAPG